jgi:hypothetical protein
VAAAICLVLAEWWHLARADLAVWTTHLVMAQYTFTIFQKGFERILGRGVGILAGLVLATCFRDVFFLRVAFTSLFLLVTFYIYFAGRLAYTFLNAGLYCMVLVYYGETEPLAAQEAGKELFLAIVLGVVVADVVVWLTGAEQDLHIDVGQAPLWPVRADWLNHSLMLVVTAFLTRVATIWLELPASQSIVSLLVLSITPDVQSALRKGQLRVLGAGLATAWSLATYILLSWLPHFPILVGSLFLGIFVAVWVTRVGANLSYAGVQMGLVLPMLLVVPPAEFGSLTGVFQRLEGILAALAAMILVGSVWPYFPLQPAAAPPAGGASQR